MYKVFYILINTTAKQGYLFIVGKFLVIIHYVFWVLWSNNIYYCAYLIKYILYYKVYIIEI